MNVEGQHRVSLPAFYLGQHPVTQAQWRAVAHLPPVNLELNPDPAHFKGEHRPVEQVSWYEAVEFCHRLSQHTGKLYRLPSEAEWEYACRAGSTTPFYFGETITPELANYNGNYSYGPGPKGEYRAQATPVGSFGVNPWGLADMHGNVFEWCQDLWHPSYDGAPRDGSAWVTGGDDRYPDGDGQPMADNTEPSSWIVIIQETLEILFAANAEVSMAGDLLGYPAQVVV